MKEEAVAMVSKAQLLTLLQSEPSIKTLLTHVITLEVIGTEITIFVAPELGLTEPLRRTYRGRIYQWLLRYGHDLSVKIV